MTKGFKITAIAAAGFVAVGTVLAVIGYALGGSTERVSSGDLQVHTAEDGGWNFGLAGGNLGSRVTDSGQVELDRFTALEVDTDFAELSFMPSEEQRFTLEYSCYNGIEKPLWRMEKEKLIIKAEFDKRDRSIRNSGKYWSITIYYPKNTEFSLVDIENDAGGLYIDGLNARTLDVELNAGELRLKNSLLGNGSISVDAGSATLENGKADHLEMEVDAGELVTKAFDTDGLIADVDMGSVKLDGILQGRTELSVSMGEIRVHTGLAREDYRLELNSALGDTSVINGEKNADESGAKHSIRAKTDMGSVKIEFTK